MKKIYEQPIINITKYAMTENITEDDVPVIGDIESEEWGYEVWE